MSGDHPKEFQVIHDTYFRDIGAAWANLQQRFQMLQTDWERAVEKASLNQDQSLFQAAQADYQRGFQDVWTDMTYSTQCADAYKKYTAAMQTAIASASPEDLDFTTMAHISQSLYTVSTTALMQRRTASATNK